MSIKMSLASNVSQVENKTILLDILLGNDTRYEIYCGNESIANKTEYYDKDGHEFDAFLYIICVLSFYALSMVLLMIKYVRREEAEMSLDYYYTEFVKRERFQCPQLQNKALLQRETTRLTKTRYIYTTETDFIIDSCLENSTT